LEFSRAFCIFFDFGERQRGEDEKLGFWESMGGSVVRERGKAVLKSFFGEKGKFYYW